jgi:hypothetical protein
MERNLRTNQKAIATMLIVGILVVVIVVGGIGAFYVLSQNAPAPTESPSPTATSTASTAPTATASETTLPSPSSSPAETAQPTATVAPSAPNIAGASSLRYSVSLTENGVVQGSYTYMGKNAGTNSFMMRIEVTSTDGNAIYIFNGAQQKAWTYSDGQWTDISELYTVQFGVWNNLWQGYVNGLSAWNGVGDYSYSSGGSTVRIYDISVNPTLEDSLFVHS